MTAIGINIELRRLGKANILVEAAVFCAAYVRIIGFKIALSVVIVWTILRYLKVLAHRRIITTARVCGRSALEAACVCWCIVAACDTLRSFRDPSILSRCGKARSTETLLAGGDIIHADGGSAPIHGTVCGNMMYVCKYVV